MAGRWEREFYQPGHGDALIRYLVFGDLPVDLEIVYGDYRTSGPPAGTSLDHFLRSEHGAWMSRWTGGYLGSLLEEDPELREQVLAAPSVALLQGEIEEPTTLDYLRNAIGVVTALLDQGGIAVLDAVSLRWWSPAEWRETIFDPAGPEPVEQVSLLASPEEDGFWLHSRGMRKFGRPDLSARGLEEDDLDTFAALFESLTATLAAGAIIPDGQRIRIGGTQIELTSNLEGTLHDPDFENVHYAFAADAN